MKTRRDFQSFTIQRDFRARMEEMEKYREASRNVAVFLIVACSLLAGVIISVFI